MKILLSLILEILDQGFQTQLYLGASRATTTTHSKCLRAANVFEYYSESRLMLSPVNVIIRLM